MAFLRRLLGGTSDASAPEGSAPEGSAPEARPPGPTDSAADDAAERAHELAVLREEQERLGELAQRQLRYADYAWTPPPQGGERRADDQDEPRG